MFWIWFKLFLMYGKLMSIEHSLSGEQNHDEIHFTKNLEMADIHQSS